MADLLELTKPRITVFVVLTAFLGFAAGTNGPLAGLDGLLLLHTLIGTALVAAGTSAFNEIAEVDLDRRMARTATRPLPAGRLPLAGAIAFALALSILGVGELWLFANGVTAFLAALTLTSYVFVYTPMKTRSPLSTIVGAIPGALPPLGGYTAAAGAIGAPGLALFALLFLWQMPHFYAIGWRHREDYGAAGFRILSTVDPTGRSSARHALAFGLLLVPVSVLPTFLGTAGLVYAAGALLLSAWFAGTAVRFFRETTDAAAKSMFLASIAWLPAIVVLLLADRVTGG
ncbi:MAG: protoheme IX farnesyltransferase [Holophagales bacterium]|nr:protoheme IX farnesyltransferase [Holophagales bacterium]